MSETADYAALENAVFAYNNLCKRQNISTPLSGDHPSGTCFIFFKGTKKDVERIRECLRMQKIENVLDLQETNKD